MLADKKLKCIYFEEYSSTNTSSWETWPGHQILRETSLLKGENVASSRSDSNTGALPRSLQLLHNTLQIKIKTR